MSSAREQLSAAIAQTEFHTPICPVYQNVVAAPVSDPDLIRTNLIDQLTGAVRWTQSVLAMVNDGATKFTECGPGKVLQGLVQKIAKEVAVEGVS
jgi:[acyl-carrier-protein] S-malonyltransferase